MNVLLSHPEDELFYPDPRWDVIVDLGRAPSATYDKLHEISGARVISLYDFSQEIEDLYLVRHLLELGFGRLVDEGGIDWWEVLSPMLVPDLLAALLLYRLGKEWGPGCKLYATRADWRASALQAMLQVELIYVNGDKSAASRRFQHYRQAFSKLSLAQIEQICLDKFDSQHALRRRFSSRNRQKKRSVFLLPSAYTNVSRTAVSYAALVPGQEFLLVLARKDGKLKSLPANVSSISLDGYFGAHAERETKSLLERWNGLLEIFISVSPELALAERAGVFQRMPSLLRWGLALRDAWIRLFESENVAGCLSADDVNPYTSVPLILARQRGLPTIACHHGALDYRMAIKPQLADFYLAKTAMEYDYLVRQCKLASESLIPGRIPTAEQVPAFQANGRPWLVFFTEPYGVTGWRMDEVYRDLLPRLWDLCQTTGLKLVFKLHPFESERGHRQLLRKHLPLGQAKEVRIFAGPIEPSLWQKTRMAMTVQSTTALRCAELGIPAFLCGWLQNAHGGYLRQFARFGVGQVLESADEISEVPKLLANCEAQPTAKELPILSPAEFHSLLSGKRQVPVAS